MDLTSKQKKNLIRIVLSLIMFCAVLITDKILILDSVFDDGLGWMFPFFIYLVIYLIIGYDVLFRGARNIIHGQILDENFLMCVATIGAFALAIYKGVSGERTEGFDEACAVLIFYQVGEWFQSYATGKSRKSISSLMDIRPDYANIKSGNSYKTVDPSDVKTGDIIIVNPGEKVPLDGIVIKGSSSFDTKALTGESLPKDVSEGDEIISGYINLTSRIEVKVCKEFYDSAVSKILDLVENASSKKSKAENFISEFAKYYTPTVVIIAIALALIPGVITQNWSVWIYRALSFLVVSCPCALVISIPLSFFAGIGVSSRHGILIKGSDYIEKINRADIFVFDKTGTLTKGNFSVIKVCPESRREEILLLASIAEHGSSHPIATAILSLYDNGTDEGYIPTNVAGEGIIAINGDDTIYCGNEKLMRHNNIPYEREQGSGTVVYIAKNGEFIGSVLIADEIKENAENVIKSLSNMGCKTFMLTGDNEKIAEDVAEKTGLTGYKASLLPQNKIEEVEKLFSLKSKKGELCFVGDGINDAPVLMRSDIGIAMGGVGSDAAIEASDIVLMNDDLTGISKVKQIAKKTMSVVKQNIIFSISVKIAILVLSSLGITNMWFAVFGDVGVAVLAILNAMRINSKY